MCVRASCADSYLQGMRDKSMRTGRELARKISLTDWSTAGELGKLVFVVSTKPSLAQFISLFATGKSRLFFKISVKQKRRKKIRFDKQNFFS